MRNKILSLFILVLSMQALLQSCQKTEYEFGDIKNPESLTLDIIIAGTDVSNPDGNGTGLVNIISTASNALTYQIDFGDGIVKMVPSGKTEYKYGIPGTNEYTITVNAIGTAGVVSTLSKKIRVNVIFEIPTAILEALTNNDSKTWVTDNEASGHIGVGPADNFEPIWYQAAPNEKASVGCLYDDEIRFTKDANNRVYMELDNKGQSFVQGASVGYYGFSGPEACYDLNTAGSKPLIFSDASSGSSTSNSTGIQFIVPGDGIINFATGSNSYEILSITESTMHLRSIGVDGNAWYQKLKVKS